MTAHALPQFTPAQVLDAGRRAEAEGRFEFAQQFYRHLVTYYANSQEAAEAQDGLRRIGGHGAAPAPGSDSAGKPGLDVDHAIAGGPPPLDPAFGGGSAKPSYANPAPAMPPRDGAHHEPSWGAGPAQSAHQRAAPAANGVQAQMRYPQPPPAQPPQYPPPTRPDRRQEAWAGAREARAAFELPPPVRGFRTGRIMARLCTWSGGLVALAGCAVIPVLILSPRSLQVVPLVGAWLTGLRFGAGIIVAGLVMIVMGQVMRALLEQANAIRDMAAIARARAEHDAEAGGRRSPD